MGRHALSGAGDGQVPCIYVHTISSTMYVQQRTPRGLCTGVSTATHWRCNAPRRARRAAARGAAAAGAAPAAGAVAAQPQGTAVAAAGNDAGGPPLSSCRNRDQRRRRRKAITLLRHFSLFIPWHGRVARNAWPGALFLFVT